MFKKSFLVRVKKKKHTAGTKCTAHFWKYKGLFLERKGPAQKPTQNYRPTHAATIITMFPMQRICPKHMHVLHNIRYVG